MPWNSARSTVIGIYPSYEAAKKVIQRLTLKGFSPYVIQQQQGSFKLRLLKYFSRKASRQVIFTEHFQNLLMSHETMLALKVPPPKFKEALHILQHTKNVEGLTFEFLPVPQAPKDFSFSKLNLPRKPLVLEAFIKHAEALSKKMPVVDNLSTPIKPLISKLHTSDANLKQIFIDLQQLNQLEESTNISSEWLLDNAYIIRSQIDSIRRTLPNRFYRELPMVTKGPFKGLARIYGCAVEFVASTDGKIDRDTLIHFINAFQRNATLTMGELWAFPLLIKLRLVECLQLLAINVIQRHRDNQEADFWANRFLNSERREPDKLYAFLAQLSKTHPVPSAQFANQLVAYLFDEKHALTTIKAWLEYKLGQDLATAITAEQQQQLHEQVSLSNIVTSLLALSRIDWREVFEEVNKIDKILGQDESYAHISFETRDAYRHVIDKLAKRLQIPEIQVADQVMQLSNSGESIQEKHPGYYLIDDGFDKLVSTLQGKPSFFERLRCGIKKYIPYIYLGAIVLFTLLLVTLKINLWFLLLLPANEIAIQLINFFSMKLSSPRIIPRMHFMEGIPDNARTLVVVPMMLSSIETIREEAEKLEIRYLGNADPNILYALCADFVDATTEHTPEDGPLLAEAKHLIDQLNEKHQTSCFFLFHRERTYNDSERCWMGWERKRGKIEQLNRFLVGKEEASVKMQVQAGDWSKAKDIQYVLTLDADTELPPTKARELIEAIAHPLNQPVYNPVSRSISKGYSIIQPRVSTGLSSGNTSLFTQIYADPSGSEPYKWAISDIYQDIFNEGIYHGKGLYSIKAFHDVLNDRFPENTILSHDLLEGAYIRVGFASDIELYDTFPSTYSAYAEREHRWIRGDWQLLPWLLSKVRNAKGKKEANPLTFISKWKIFDNLRRSLVAPALIALLLTSWFGGWWIGSLIALAVIFLPLVLPFSKEQAIKTFQRSLLTLTLLPSQAYNSLDAVIRALYRTFISRRKVLEWKVASGNQQDRFHKMVWIPIFSVLILSLLSFVKIKAGILLALPFLILWSISPWIVKYLNRTSLAAEPIVFPEKSKQFLRRIARRTWKYFEDFVNEENFWLPPDNYQEKLNIEVAKRTSSTNIGLYFLSVLTAKDFGYISLDKTVTRIHNALESIQKLELYEGNLLNWYSLENLQPLLPKYVSTVDSGNLIASLWTVEQALLNFEESPLLSNELYLGLKDTIKELNEETHHPELIQARLEIASQHLQKFQLKNIQDIKIAVSKITLLESDLKRYVWYLPLLNQLKDWEYTADTYFPWVTAIEKMPLDLFKEASPISKALEDILQSNPSLKELVSGTIPGLATLEEWAKNNPSEPWSLALQDSLKVGKANAEKLLAFIEDIIQKIQTLAQGMKLGFLYIEDRKLFSIGYNVSDRRLDSSCYDLLASEARIASFVAIAQGDVPIEHWWALGRPFRKSYGKMVLQSWGGTMFEYLMPAIFMRQYENTLLYKACDDAVHCQMAFGQMRGIPWGISESAYSGLNYFKTYQYRAFGVPGLGLKRGLEDDLVVTPYSSALALMVDPFDSTVNLQRLTSDVGMLGEYGFYESIDYSRESDQEGKRGVIIYAYMVHHMSMTLAAINNTLHEQRFQKLFHENLRVKANEALLYERIPTNITSVERLYKEAPIAHITPITPAKSLQRVNHPNALLPHVHLLSNGSYSTYVSNNGKTYSRWNSVDITRWRADSTTGNCGILFYIKEADKKPWSASYNPIACTAGFFEVDFKNGKAIFKRKENGLECTTEIVVSPEDPAEIHSLTFANLTNKQKVIEITSYCELALAPHSHDKAHPAFSKMFVETEYVPSEGLLAFRKKRSPSDKEYYAFHTIALESSEVEEIEFETSREKFIGFKNNLLHPRCLNHELSYSTGYVLDPIFSIRYTLTLDPGKRVKLSYVLGATDNRKDALHHLKKYREMKSISRVLDMAWTHAEINLRYMHITQETGLFFHQLATNLLYSLTQLRASQDLLRRNKQSQNNLWAYQISGDLPIVVLAIDSSGDLFVVKELLLAHTFWHLHGINCDIVILNKEAQGYNQPLNDELKKLIAAHQLPYKPNEGSIYLLSADQMPPQDIDLFYTVARMVFIASRGSLKQQFLIPPAVAPQTPLLQANPNIPEQPSPLLPFLQLHFYNGCGGFTTDFKEYTILSDSSKQMFAPWINVISNARFGAILENKGVGTTWYQNSQQGRLTPWSNDPIIDPITDIVYIRDEDSGTYWSIGPDPITEMDTYRVRHGQGYSVYEHNSHAIQQEMTVFVPVGGYDTLRIQKVVLTNFSSKKRRLSVTHYLEWVLGGNKEDTQPYICTLWDGESEALFAYNNYHPCLKNKVSFATSHPSPFSFTADRGEFIGRNNNLSAPQALKHAYFSGRTGCGLDACSAIQTSCELEPNEQIELYYLVGEANDMQEARDIIQYYRNSDHIEKAYSDLKEWWNSTLETIQVSTPDLSTNILFNRWMLYQSFSCRIWARTAFYQSSGAYGFRDQLQDVMALLYTHPEMTKKQILIAASRQFLEGDVQHWWDPVTGEGVRTRITDDLLWLPYVTVQYVKVTGDLSIFQERVHYLVGRELTEEEHEMIIPTTTSQETGSILDHCCKAIHKALRFGAHGLPLMGGGDWNDGMNTVGLEGKGESVWLGWFLITVLQDIIPYVDPVSQKRYTDMIDKIAHAIDKNAWDGEWYLRAYYDDGTPLGSHTATEAYIDSLSQSWAVISGKGDPEKVKTALASVEKHLVKKEDKLLLLLTLPFEKSAQNPGYIKGYPPGVRENGGQYTHAALWFASALAQHGDGKQAVELLHMINPINHTLSEEDLKVYRTEPYAIAADIYSLSTCVGRAGWTWYTGSAGVMYRTWLETIFGFKKRGETLELTPSIPEDWPGFTLTYKYLSTEYHFTVENTGKGRHVDQVLLDEKEVPNKVINLVDDHVKHNVVIKMS